jgi:fatty acid synthase subunit alpha, fungi type
LVGASNIVAHELESYSVRIFSAKEMAFNIVGLMCPLLFSITQVEAIWADPNRGMDRLSDLADYSSEAECVLQTVNVTPLTNFCFDFPALESFEPLADVDLDKVIVIRGFTEVGPWGSSKTRWEMEARGQFTHHRRVN